MLKKDLMILVVWIELIGRLAEFAAEKRKKVVVGEPITVTNLTFALGVRI